jgi:hypothetical protein
MASFFIETQPAQRNNVWFQTLSSMRSVRHEAARLNHVVQKGIGDQLRAMYNEAMEHVPNRHLDLLQRFERDEASRQVAVPQKVPSLENTQKY